MSDMLAGVQFGDTLYVSPSDRRYGPDRYTFRVVKIGRKWVSCLSESRWDRLSEEGRRDPAAFDVTQFHISTGRENSNVGIARRAYTPQQWEDRQALTVARTAWNDTGFGRDHYGDPTSGMTPREAADLYDALTQVVRDHRKLAGLED